MAKQKVQWSQGLSQKQAEACVWAAKGLTNEEIAHTMGYKTLQSVKNLLRDAAKVLGTNNRVQIALLVHGIEEREQ